VDLNAFELDDIWGGGGGRELLSNLRTTDGRVVTVFCVRILWIVGETDGSWRRALSGLVYVCHVHQVILESVVVVVLQP